MSQSCQTKVQNCFSNVFAKWAGMVAKRTTIVFLISLAVFIGLSLGMTKSKSAEDEQFVWTPAENQSILNYRKSKELFANDEKSRFLQVIAESTGDNLLNKESFAELISFNEMLYGITEFRSTTMDDDKNAVRPSEGDKVGF